MEPSASCLPEEVLVAIFKRLDHDTLALVPRVCKSWHQAARDDLLWRHHYLARGMQPLQAPGSGAAAPAQSTSTLTYSNPVMEPAGSSGEAPSHDAAELASPAVAAIEPAAPEGGWLQAYKQAYSAVCYECFRPTQRFAAQAAPLRLRLCHDCWQGFTGSTAQQRLVTTTEAKYRYEIAAFHGSAGMLALSRILELC